MLYMLHKLHMLRMLRMPHLSYAPHVLHVAPCKLAGMLVARGQKSTPSPHTRLLFAAHISLLYTTAAGSTYRQPWQQHPRWQLGNPPPRHFLLQTTCCAQHNAAATNSPHPSCISCLPCNSKSTIVQPSSPRDCTLIISQLCDRQNCS